MPPAAKKPGRPAKEPNQPPMPASWKETERLAVCLAYLEASERGAATPDVLEGETQRLYPGQLDVVCNTVSDFIDSAHKWPQMRKTYIYTREESKKRRPERGALVNVFKQTRKYFLLLLAVV